MNSVSGSVADKTAPDLLTKSCQTDAKVTISRKRTQEVSIQSKRILTQDQEFHWNACQKKLLCFGKLKKNKTPGADGITNKLLTSWTC